MLAWRSRHSKWIGSVLTVWTRRQTGPAQTMYDRCNATELSEFTDVMDIKGRVDIRRNAGFQNNLRARNKASIGRFEAQERSLGCEVLLFCHAMTPHKHEVRRVMGSAWHHVWRWWNSIAS